MIDSDLLQAFCEELDELEKLGAMSEGERKRRAHERYVRNRARNIQRSKRYRVQHRPEIARKKRIYNRRVRTGTRRQRRRISTGSFSFAYAGYK